MNPSETKKQKNPRTGNVKYGNLTAKILCVLAAFVLWVYVMAVESPAYEVVFSGVTVRLENEDILADRSLSVYNGYDNKVDITLAGKKSRLSKLSSEDIVAVVDLSEKSVTGRSDCRITVDVPDGCKLVTMSKDTVSVYIDKSEKKELELEAKITNLNLDSGYEVGPYDLNVDYIQIRGASRIVGAVSYASVEFDLEGSSQTREATADVKLYDAYGKEIDSPYLECTPSRITAEIPIIKRVEVPVEVRFRYGYLNSENSRTVLSVQTVTVSGDPVLVNRGNFFSPIVIDEKLDFDENGVCIKKVNLTPPDGLTFSEENVEVEVIISSNIETRRITVPGKNIVDSGASENVSYSIDRSNVRLTLMGPFEELTAIDPDDITLWLDMSLYDDIEPGIRLVPAKVVIDSGFGDDVIELGTYEIEVTFRD